MSVFTSRVSQRTLTVPGDPANTITIRKLAPKHLDEAAKANAREYYASIDPEAVMKMKTVSDLTASVASVAEAKKEVEDAVAAKADAQPPTPPDPIAGYHRVTMMRRGVTAWTFVDDAGAPIERTDDNFEDMDEDTQIWLVTEIMKFAKPALFASKDAQEEARFSA